MEKDDLSIKKKKKAVSGQLVKKEVSLSQALTFAFRSRLLFRETESSSTSSRSRLVE